MLEKQLSAKTQLKTLAALAIPVSIGQAGNIITSMTDTAMLGKYDSMHMIASTFGFNVFIIVFILLIGLSIGLTALTAEKVGEGKHYSIFGTALYTYLTVAVLLCIFIYFLSFELSRFHPDPAIVALSEPYLIIMGISLIPLAIFFSFKQYFEAFGFTILATAISLFSNVLNILLNYLLIFGKFGFPPMGIEGAAYATLIARTVGIPLFILIVIKNKKYSSKIKKADFKFNFKKAKQLISMGIPISFQMFIEITSFALAGIFVGWIGNVELGAHQIAFQLSAFTYLLASGFGSASTVLAGQYLGEKNKRSILILVKNVLVLIIIYEIFTAALFWLFTDSLPYIFLGKEDIDIILMASFLIKFAAIFQIPDGIQNVLQGLLRGLQDVKTPTWITISAHWVFSLLTGYYLAFEMEFGVSGIWYGFVIGLTISAIFLYIRLRYILKKLNGNIFAGIQS